jgi:DNA-binding transcriptional regulator YiaG
MDGADIRTLRKRLALTQEEFAHEIGVTFATVNRWENHKSKPSRLALRILAVLMEKTDAATKKSSRRTSKKRKKKKAR